MGALLLSYGVGDGSGRCTLKCESNDATKTANSSGLTDFDVTIFDAASGQMRTTATGSTGGPMGLLSTAGGVLFGNDGGGNFVAYDAATGRPLWHAGLNTNTSNGPETFLLDGRQFVVVGAWDALYAFALQN